MSEVISMESNQVSMKNIKNSAAARWLDYGIFRQNLNQLLKSRGMEQKALAEAIDVTTATISRYAHQDKEPTLDYLYRIANYFGVTLDWLVGASNNKYVGYSDEVLEFANLYCHASSDDRKVVQAVLSKYAK